MSKGKFFEIWYLDVFVNLKKTAHGYLQIVKWRNMRESS